MQYTYYQTNPEYMNIKLGGVYDGLSTRYTIGESGCLLCCLSNILDISPAELNERLRFTRDGLIIWSSVYPYVIDIDINYKGVIDLTNGYYIAAINNNSHFVNIIDENTYFDVYDGRIKPLNKIDRVIKVVL